MSFFGRAVDTLGYDPAWRSESGVVSVYRQHSAVLRPNYRVVRHGVCEFESSVVAEIVSFLGSMPTAEVPDELAYLAETLDGDTPIEIDNF